MDLTKVYWEADLGTSKVNSKENQAYKKVRRVPMQSLTFYIEEGTLFKKRKNIKVFKRPNTPKWDIMWRLRSQIEMGVMGGDSGKVARRFWIIKDQGEHTIIYEDLNSKSVKKLKDDERAELRHTSVDDL